MPIRIFPTRGRGFSATSYKRKGSFHMDSHAMKTSESSGGHALHIHISIQVKETVFKSWVITPAGYMGLSRLQNHREGESQARISEHK